MERATRTGRRPRSGLLAGVIATIASVASAQEVYTIERGDTLTSIAQRHAVTVERLMQINKLQPASRLQPGQRLTVPDTAPTAPATVVGYQVRPGDNLYRIAQRLGVDVEALMRANSLTPQSILQIGQTLQLPAGVPPTAQALGVVRPQPQLPAPAPAPLPEAVEVSEDRVHLRVGPSTEQRSLGLVSEGARLQVIGKAGGWWQVRTASGADAYVAGWLVAPSAQTLAPAPVPTPSVEAATALAQDDEAIRSLVGELAGLAPIGQAVVTASQASLRPEPNLGLGRIATAAKGTRAAVLEVNSDWARLRFDNGQGGWVPRSALRVRLDGAGGSERGSRLLSAAMGYLGVPYRRGGTSRGGVDCSGLVYAVCRENGISLPRTARDMWGHGEPVATGQMEPGDLVFFKNTYRSGISHVGIYAGNGEFIHAPRSGTTVRVESLSSSYYQAHWAGAYRIAD